MELNLNDVPGRTPVETSQGELFVKSLTIGDVMYLEKLLPNNIDGDEQRPECLVALGEAAFKRLVSSEPEPPAKILLSDDIFSKLTSSDLRALALAILEDGDYSQLDESEVIEGFGKAIFDKVESISLKSREIISRNFATMSANVKSVLGDSLIGLTQAQKNLIASPMFEAIRSINESPAVRAIRAMQDSPAVSALKKIHGSSAVQAIRDLEGSSALSSLRKAQENRIPQLEDSRDAIQRALRSQPEMPLEATVKAVNRPAELNTFTTPPFERTPAGRTTMAVEESAKQLKEVVGLVGVMSERFVQLHTTFITEVIPQWVNNLNQNAEAAQSAFEQAQKNLFVAKWALVFSIVVSVAMTSWQVWIGQEYRREDDKQQVVIEDLMQKQLAETKAQNKLLAEEISELRKALIEIRLPPEKTVGK